MKKIILFIFCSIVFFSYFKVMANEEAKYKVVKSNKIYEIRKYSDRLVVQAINTNENSSFRKLFNYISGANETNEKIEMTIPVTEIKKKGHVTMQFYLPSKFNKSNAPKPSNPDIKILTIKGGYYAVIKYSGRSSDTNFIKNKDILENQLKKDKIVILSPPIRASYNSPFTLPMLKRNEIMFRVDL